MMGKKTLWQCWVARGDSQGRTIVLGLVLLLVALVTYLIFGANPWIAGFFDKVAAGKATTLAEHVAAGGWFGAAINATICLLLVSTSAWWMAPSPLAARAANRDASAVWGVSRTSRANEYRGGWWFWGLLIVAVGLAGTLRFQRLNRDFSSTEQLAVSEMIRGAAATNSVDGSEVLSWQQTVFGLDQEGAQPAARLSARLIDSVMGSSVDGRDDSAKPGTAAVRGGPFFAGIIAIVGMALWLRVSGAPLAGVMAAFLLAVNPWHLRWSSTVGGYSEALSWLLVAMVVTAAALESGLWRWFLLGGFLQALALLSYSGAAAAVVTLAIFSGLALVIRRDGVSFGRWLVATCIAGLLVIQILAPVVTASIVATGLKQVAAAASQESGESGIPWVDIWSKASAGGPWAAVDDVAGASAVDPTTVTVTDMDPAGSWIFGLVLPLLAIAGLIVGVVRGRLKMTLLCSAIGSGLYFMVRSGRDTSYESAFGDWNILFLSVVFCLALASIVEWLRKSESLMDRSRMAPKGEGKAAWAVAIVLVALYTFVTWAPRSALL